MKLYISPTSPFVRKVRLYAIQLGLMDDIEQINTVVSPDKINEEYRAVNPLIQVPALITSEGILISDSTAICDHLARLANVDMFPVTGTQRDQSMQVHTLINGATEAIVQSVYETLKRPPEFVWQQQITSRTAKAMSAMEILAQGPAGLFDIGETLSLNQCAMITLIDYLALRRPELDLSGFAQLIEFAHKTANMDGVELTAPPR